MMMEGCITGIGWVTPASAGNRGRVLKPGLIDGIPAISRKDILDTPYKPFGRMDNFSKIGFAAIAFALEDAQIPTEKKKKDISLIASSATGCIQTDIRYWQTVGCNAPSPAVFAYTLDSCFLGEAAICFGLAGENFIINEKNATGLTGVFFALEHLHSGQSRAAVCGVCNSDIRSQDPDAMKMVPGALFFVIEKSSNRGLSKVQAASPRHIHDENKNEFTDLYDLAKVCCREKERQF